MVQKQEKRNEDENNARENRSYEKKSKREEGACHRVAPAVVSSSSPRNDVAPFNPWAVLTLHHSFEALPRPHLTRFEYGAQTIAAAVVVI